ncbi:MAG: hypothetical protein GY790_16085 [Bacteroidetes bacterium]|nr:hypothetical protein [Bacteroidota bacterium]
MEKSKSSASSKAEKAIHHVEYVNLQEFGYEKSGNVKGDPEIYTSYLNMILNGDLLDEKSSGLNDDEKPEKRNKLKKLEAKLEEASRQNEETNTQIKVKQDKIDVRREELLDIHKKYEKDPEAMKRETFSPFKFSISLFILLMLTGYLFFFYVSAAYKALYTDFEGIAERLAAGMGTGSIMPKPAELAEALQYNFLLFLVPFVFYAFGWAFHVILELRHKYKFVFLGGLITITFFVDFLLALLIHNNTEYAKELMGIATKSWAANPAFYMILFLGFIVYVLWSILLDSMFREWSKRLVTINLKKIIKHLRNDIKDFQNKLVPEEPIRFDIANLREDIGSVILGNLKSYIDQFTTGWISYLSPQNLKEVKVKCMNIKKEFEEKHAIKSGTVKVVKRRS